MSRRLFSALALALALAGCASEPSAPSPPAESPIVAEAGLALVPARDVELHGKAIALEADAKLFWSFVPARDDAARAPVIVLFNGFSAEVVRSFGTGPRTVADGGDVIANPSSLTSMANLLYVDPRQAGFSYDVLANHPATAKDCSADVFNEYVDAADVLLAVLAFLDAHPALDGPIVWLGESYGGVRVQWILAYLHARFDLAGYHDPTLDAALARSTRDPAALARGQLLLEPWLVGRAHAEAIDAACSDPALEADVAKSLGVACATDACSCATTHDRSLYNYVYTSEHQTRREREASLAHVTRARVEALLGVPITSVPGLAAHERAKGFKCSPADDTVPPEPELVAALGALPAGQRYYVPYAPLQPGKEIAPSNPDWRATNALAPAVADGLVDVPAFVTAGARDLVVPPSALAPALRATLGKNAIHDRDDALCVQTKAGERCMTRGSYADAGHMITMIAPDLFARDAGAWMAANVAR